MDDTTASVEPVDNITSLATWARQRSDDELRSFIDIHHARLAEIDLGLS